MKPGKKVICIQGWECSMGNSWRAVGEEKRSGRYFHENYSESIKELVFKLRPLVSKGRVTGRLWNVGLE